MKRRPLKVAVFLALGAAVNVAVAWAVTVWWPNPTDDKLPLPFPDAQAIWARYFPEESHLVQYADRVRYCGPAQQSDIVALGDNVHDVGVASTGWPMVAMSTAITADRHGQISIHDAWQLDSIDTYLPLRPAWPGFAINTIFYGAILWLLFAAPGTIRRWRRVRRGLCGACAYPVGESDTCTECGAVVQCADSRKPTAESLHS